MECTKCGAGTAIVVNGDGPAFCKDCISFEMSGGDAKYRLGIGVHKIQCGLWALFAILLIANLFLGVGSVIIASAGWVLIPLFFVGLNLAVIKGLKKEKTWAVLFSLVMNAVLLFAFPIGTLLGGMAIYSVVKTWFF